jgi:hypothetical protein
MKDAGVGQAGDEFECGGSAATLKFIPNSYQSQNAQVGCCCADCHELKRIEKVRVSAQRDWAFSTDSLLRSWEHSIILEGEGTI